MSRPPFRRICRPPHELDRMRSRPRNRNSGSAGHIAPITAQILQAEIIGGHCRPTYEEMNHEELYAQNNATPCLGCQRHRYDPATGPPPVRGNQWRNHRNGHGPVAGGHTAIDVSASTSITAPSRTDLGSTLDSNATQNLPLVSRNPYNFILFQPNVSGRANTEFGVPRRVNANGFNGRINYQLDGSNNTESDRAGIRLIPISNSYVREVQQVSNGFAPEFGNTVGAVFNTITKSGSNDYHGEASYIFRRTPVSART